MRNSSKSISLITHVQPGANLLSNYSKLEYKQILGELFICREFEWPKWGKDTSGKNNLVSWNFGDEVLEELGPRKGSFGNMGSSYKIHILESFLDSNLLIIARSIVRSITTWSRANRTSIGGTILKPCLESDKRTSKSYRFIQMTRGPLAI